jgi:hypothetical protein
MSITVNCEFGIFGMDPKPGTMTFSPDSDMALFESADGKTRTWVHRSVLSDGVVHAQTTPSDTTITTDQGGDAVPITRLPEEKPC